MNQRFSFQTGWKFLPDFCPQAIDPDYPLSLLASWEDVSLPHSLRLEPYRNGTIPTHQGFGMYRKHFRVEETLRDKLISGGSAAMLKHRGIWYPNSILLEERSQFRLPEGCTKLYGKISMKRSGIVRLFADSAAFASITRSGAFCLNLPKASRLTLEAPPGTKLLSPFLSDEPLSLQDTRKNLAVKCRCTASSHPADAGNVMKKGHLWETMWVGDPIGGNPEYFQVDLGRCFDIRDVMVYIGGQMGSDCTNYTYEIHTSPDGAHWDVQARTRRTSWSNGAPDCFRAPSVRFVRVVFIHVDGGLLPALSKIHVYEDQSHQEKGECI